MFFRDTEKGIVLNIRVMPNASSCAFRGLFTGADGTEYLKVAVVSVPEKGKANKELLTFLAKKLNLPKSCMELISGDTDRYKRILVKQAGGDVLAQMENLQKEAENDSCNN
ncbi:MAG: DUF167 domain-containing protein [Alphaproteobacteria bacterium]|nr:DUF167 domain-containing protein [Alphaproteobacteria bacterium]